MTSLTADDYELVKKYAERENVPYNACLAFMSVETGMNKGEKVGGMLRPLIRWEGHYFDRLIPKALQKTARELKLASPKVGGIPNPADQTGRYLMLDRGKRLDVTAAISSCSWAIGQVMGAHWKWLGYSSAEEFEKVASSGFSGQLAIMFAFMVKSGVVPHLRRLDWSAVARIWNGPAYAKNQYDVKMKKAYEHYEGAPAPKPSSAGMLRPGSKGQKVRELQALLVRAGYAINVDGDFGASTERAVKAFQAKSGSEIDGVAGPKTMEELQRFKVTPEEKVGVEKPLDNAQVKQGLWSMAGGAAGLQTAKAQLQEAKGQLTEYVGVSFIDSALQWLTVGMAVVTVAGLGYAAYGLWKKRRSKTGIEESMA